MQPKGVGLMVNEGVENHEVPGSNLSGYIVTYICSWEVETSRYPVKLVSVRKMSRTPHFQKRKKETQESSQQGKTCNIYYVYG